MITTVVSFILVLGLLVLVHELGHFLVAKRVGIYVQEFALGFGPRLWSRKKGETNYSLRVFPLGGFVKLIGEFPADEQMDPEEFSIMKEAQAAGGCVFQKTIAQRFAVFSMGSFSNFFLAILLFALIFVVSGIPVPVGIHIEDVFPNTPAQEAGLQKGDGLLAVNGEPVDQIMDAVLYIQQNPGQNLNLSVQREGEEIVIPITPGRTDDDRGHIGVSFVQEVNYQRVGFFQAAIRGFFHTFSLIGLIIMGLVQMITGVIAPDVVGPVGIAQEVGRAAQVGLVPLLNLTAFISINLGIINLLPLPALDGGRLLFLFIEKIRGRPVDPHREGFVHFIGFVLLMVLIVFIIYRDIARILL